MLYITCQIDTDTAGALGAKELIAMELEKFGKVKVIGVKEVTPKQTTLFERTETRKEKT